MADDASFLEAATRGDIQKVKQYVDAGHRPDDARSEYDRRTALMLAAIGGHYDTVKLLLEHGAQIDLQGPYDRRTALMLAAIRGHYDTVKLLLEHGAQIDLQGPYKQTALMMAAREGYHDTVKVLLDNGAQAGLQSEDQKKALDFAIEYGHHEIAELFWQRSWADLIAKEEMVRLPRACVMVVGEGGAGKSSLVDSLGDKPFKPKDSTAGVATTTVDTTDMHNWQEIRLSEFEQAMCAMISSRQVEAANSPSAVIGLNSSSAAVGADSPSAVLGAESPSADVGVNSASAVVGAESPSAIVGADSRSADVGAESPSAVVVADSSSAVVGAESPSAVVGADSPSAVVGAESPSAVVGDNSASSIAGAGYANAGIEEKVSSSASEATAASAKAASPMSNVPRRLQKLPEGAPRMIRSFRKEKKSGVIAVVMDFGGQKVLHAMHSVLLHRLGTFLLVFSIPKLLDKRSRPETLRHISHWLSSIAFLAPEAKVFIVGTHKDKLSKLAQKITFRGKQYKQRKLAQAQKILANFLPGLYVAKVTTIIQNIERPSPDGWCFTVDIKSRKRIKFGGKCSDESIRTLRDRLQKVLMNDQRKVRGLDGVLVPYSELRIPLKALRLLETLKSAPDSADGDDRSTSRSVCSFDEVQRVAAQLGLPSRRESVEYLLRIFTGMRSLKWFREVDPSLVVLDLQWLLDSMAALIREHEGKHSQLLDHLKKDKQAIPLLQEDKVRRGIFPVDLFNFIWSSDKAHYGALNGKPDEIRALTRILEHSGLICRIQMLAESSGTRQEYYVVPALLPELPSHVDPGANIRKFMQQPNAVHCTCTWDFSHSKWLPDHVFERLACTVVASREDLSLHEEILACDVVDISSGGAIMLLRLDSKKWCITAETVNYDDCPHSSRWMYKIVQAALDKVLPQLCTDESRKSRRATGIYKVRLSTTDGADFVELPKLHGSHKIIRTVSGAPIPCDRLKDMWLNDAHGCGDDCCRQPVHVQTSSSSTSIPKSSSMSPPWPPSKHPPFLRFQDEDLAEASDAAAAPLVQPKLASDTKASAPEPSNENAKKEVVVDPHTTPSADEDGSAAAKVSKPSKHTSAAPHILLPHSMTKVRRPGQMVAFVAGMGNYKGHRTLKNPVSDAQAVQILLEAQHVEVHSAFDCGIKELQQKFDLFAASLRPGDAAFLYFAGHGTQFNNAVRLMAISDSEKPDIEKDALNLNKLIASMTLQKTCLITCFLDCCREFTFDASEVIAGPARSGKSAQQLTLFACEPNGYAYDGKGKHGVFTEILLKYLAMLNLELSELARLVTKEVVEKLGIKQRPYKESILWDLWCLFTKHKYTLRPPSVDFLQQNLCILEQQLQDSEDQYRHFAIEECAMEEDSVRANIMKARSAPHSNKRLQRIHEDYKAFMAAEKQLRLSASSNKSRDRKAVTR